MICVYLQEGHEIKSTLILVKMLDSDKFEQSFDKSLSHLPVHFSLSPEGALFLPSVATPPFVVIAARAVFEFFKRDFNPLVPIKTPSLSHTNEILVTIQFKYLNLSKTNKTFHSINEHLCCYFHSKTYNKKSVLYNLSSLHTTFHIHYEWLNTFNE